ncbi:hypothetical protein Pint_15068 [Pistacia integerrima]|uniref:Uncharacterized protein n=1 Tax=Pistacia integerrima TaxID=434235 RepID=A0ACC0ZCL8_9ROSI|nr:hypothetical protein Pint_15068 [Pistacia integerrima]
MQRKRWQSKAATGSVGRWGRVTLLAMTTVLASIRDGNRARQQWDLVAQWQRVTTYTFSKDNGVGSDQGWQWVEKRNWGKLNI